MEVCSEDQFFHDQSVHQCHRRRGDSLFPDRDGVSDRGSPSTEIGTGRNRSDWNRGIVVRGREREGPTPSLLKESGTGHSPRSTSLRSIHLVLAGEGSTVDRMQKC